MAECVLCVQVESLIAHWRPSLMLNSFVQEVLANCSDSFKADHAAFFESVRGKQAELAVALFQALFLCVGEFFEPPAKELLSWMSSEQRRGGDAADLALGHECSQGVEEALTKAIQSVPDAHKDLKASMLPEVIAEKLSRVTCAVRELLELLRGCAATLHKMCDQGDDDSMND